MFNAFPLAVRTNQYDFTFQYEYLLYNNRIWIRSHDQINPKTIKAGNIEETPGLYGWQLFDVTGIPSHNKHGHSLIDQTQGEKIIEISVASELIAAVSRHPNRYLDRIFIYKGTIPGKYTMWASKIGRPFSKALYMPHNRRSWSFSVSIGESLKKKVDFIHPNEQVLFYSDGNGVPHEVGFTGTIYVLLADGRRIVYWDTGLPTSFSRGFLSPERGTTQGQMISSAGSTVFGSFLRRKLGPTKRPIIELCFYTIHDDYEKKTAPGFKYSFTDPELNPPIVGEKVPLGRGVRRMPIYSWIKHDVSHINPANLSHVVSIHLIGKGDENRLLRIEGKAPGPIQGSFYPGVYQKKIYEIKWAFVPTGPLVWHDFELPAIPCPYNFNLEPMLKNYKFDNYYGHLKDFPAITISLKDFHPLNNASEPAILTISDGMYNIKVNLYTVDGWGILFHKEDHEELIGTVDGESKVLRGTFIISSEEKNKLYSLPIDSQLSVYIRSYILTLEGITNTLTLTADNQLVKLKSNDTSLLLYFNRELSQQEIRESYYIRHANNIELSSWPHSFEHCKDLIRKNLIILERIKKIHKAMHRDNLGFTVVDQVIQNVKRVIYPIRETCFYFAQKFFKELPIKEMGEQALKDLGVLNTAWKDSCLTAVKSEHQLFHQAKKIIEERIVNLSEIREKIRPLYL